MPYSNERFIAMTDLETSGDVPSVHEILEIGLVVFDQKTFEIKDKLETKVRPVCIHTAVKAALEYNGYNDEGWKGAMNLSDAMKIYREKTQNCIFCAYNASFDWGFINEAFHVSELPNPMSTIDNHDRLDLLSIAWERGLKNHKSLSLKTACEIFGIPPEPEPHSALNGAMTAYNLFKKLCAR